LGGLVILGAVNAIFTLVVIWKIDRLWLKMSFITRYLKTLI